MADAPLRGAGVLVTRAANQAAELTNAIELAGGRAYSLPALDIVALSTDETERSHKALPTPDIVVFVSRNAVRFGYSFAGSAAVAAIGPGTAAELEAAGVRVDIVPTTGFTSERLLDEPELRDVTGVCITIVRGEDGRERLADTLRARGAIVSYLPVYRRAIPETSPETLKKTESAWLAGDINVITIMSVATLHNLLALLPGRCRELLENTPAVTPSERVIIELLKQVPASLPVLATGPDADAIVDAIGKTLKTGLAHEQ